MAPPIHEIHAKHLEGDPLELEILLDEAWADTWRFRRDLAVTRPVADIGLQSKEGVPFLAPEIVLLYKAKNPRPHDEQDFQTVLPGLPAERREWLAAAIERVHPNHPWLPPLRTTPASRQSS